MRQGRPVPVQPLGPAVPLGQVVHRTRHLMQQGRQRARAACIAGDAVHPPDPQPGAIVPLDAQGERRLSLDLGG